jgi:hypothetical protein
MNRIRTAFAVVFAAVVAAAGCNDYGNTFQGNTGVSLQFVSPSNATAGGPDLTISLTAFGGNSAFVVQTTVTWDQKNLKTCVVTTTAANTCAPSNDTGTVVSVTAVVPAAMTATPGTHFVQTVQPHSGAGNNGLSNPLAFVVFPKPNPAPTVSSIAPTSATAGSGDLQLTITGTNFLPTSDPSGGSQVRWNTASQTNLTATSITSTQIQATVPAALLTTASSAIVTVFNPPAPPPSGCQVNCTGNGGGGTSNGTTFTITASGAAVKANGAVVQEETPAVSSDGRYVAYTASQSGHAQILARDTCLGADSSCQTRTLLVSSALDGTAANDDSHSPSMSSDGRYVAFSSAATNLAADSGTGRQVYLRDTCFGVEASCAPSTQLISTDPKGSLVGAESILPSISASGRFVAFLAVSASYASNAPSAEKSGAAGPPNSGFRQVFVRDTCLGASNCTPATTRISLQPGDSSGSGAKPAGPAISGSAGHAALASATSATFFTRSLAVDDGVFLALTRTQP